jgi:hypothetical protein
LIGVQDDTKQQYFCGLHFAISELLMIEAYRVGITLALEGGSLTGPLGDVIKAFERANQAVGDVRSTVRELVTDLRGAIRIAGRLADELERVKRATNGTARGLSAALNVASGQPPSGENRNTNGAGGGRPTALPPLLLNGPDQPRGTEQYGASQSREVGFPGIYSNGAVPPPIDLPGPKPRINPLATGMAAWAGFDFLRGLFTAAAEPDDIIEKMRSGGFSEADIAQSKSVALSQMAAVPGSGYASNLDIINKTKSITADAGEAIDLVAGDGKHRGLAFDAQVLSLFGKGDAAGQIEAAVKAGELTGLNGPNGKVDLSKLMEFVDRLTSTVVASGGSLDIGKYLTGVRQFGAGADAASLDFTTAILPAYMKILGEAKTGTALASFQQVMLRPPPTDKHGNTIITQQIAEQESLGLRDANGQLSASDRDLISRDVNAYFIKRIMPALLEHGITSPSAVRSELSMIMERATMERLSAAGFFDRAIIDKDANMFLEQQARGSGPLDTLLKNSPSNQMSAFEEAWKAFEAALGDSAMKPAIASLNMLTAALNGLSTAAANHPKIAEQVGLQGFLLTLGGGAALGGKIAGSILNKLGLETAGGAISTMAETLFTKAVIPAMVAEAVSGVLKALGSDHLRQYFDRAIPWNGKIDKWLHDHTGGWIGEDNMPPVQKQSYVSNGAANMQPQKISFTGNLITPDGRNLGRFVAEHMERSMGAASRGYTPFDPSMSAMPSGATVQA